jgi:hypothetical protein
VLVHDGLRVVVSCIRRIEDVERCDDDARPLGVAARHPDPAGDLLERSVHVIRGVERIGAERQRADLSGSSSRAALEPAARHDSHADTGADRDEREVREADRVAPPPFRECRNVHVVVDGHGDAKFVRECTTDVDVGEWRKVGSEQQRPAVGDARNPDGCAGDARPVDSGVVRDPPAKAGDLREDGAGVPVRRGARALRNELTRGVREQRSDVRAAQIDTN